MKRRNFLKWLVAIPAAFVASKLPEQKLIPASFRGKKFYMSKQSKSKIVSGSIISITVAGETFSVVPAAKTGRKLEGFENKLNR